MIKYSHQHKPLTIKTKEKLLCVSLNVEMRPYRGREILSFYTHLLRRRGQEMTKSSSKLTQLISPLAAKRQQLLKAYSLKLNARSAYFNNTTPFLNC